MSSHPRSAHSSHSSLRHRRQPQFRVTLYMLLSLILGAALLVAVELRARSVEHLRSVGINVDGVITDLSIKQAGGRTTYWVAGEYAATSASGIALTLPFRYDVTAAEYRDLATGDSVALIYDPAERDQPQRASILAREDTAGLRTVAYLAAILYVAIGTAISIFDWRLRVRDSRRSEKLRSAFGVK